MTRVCETCHTSFEATRADARTCSARCRQRKRRHGYVVTAEDRAAIERVFARAEPCPLPELTPEQVRAHVTANARWE